MYSTKLIYTNPFITEAMAKRISEKVFGLTYMPCNVSWRGNPAHEAGDAVRVVDRYGVKHTVLIMQQTINFGGGLSAQISCPGETGEEADGAMSSPTGQQISAAMGQVDADMKAYIAEISKLTLQAAKEYTDEALSGFTGDYTDGNEVSY